MYRHALCVFPYQRTRSSMTSFPPMGLEYVAAALRPHAEQIDLVSFRHERTASSQPSPQARHGPGLLFDQLAEGPRPDPR